MAYCCSQCSFTAQFESALMMHRQLHHEASAGDDFPELGSPKLKKRSSTMPRVSPPSSPFSANKNRGLKLPARTSSATKLLGKIKARICKSKTLFSHAEVPESNLNVNNLSARSDCTSKALKAESVLSRTSDITACMEEQKETYRCHLCHFEADRITVLDRHLLNLHKIGLENLLKLVMAKTKDGLLDDPNSTLYGIKQPYYRPQNEIIDEGEFIIETVTPRIKILKHASTNTENVTPESSLERNCQYISKEIESLINGENKFENEDILNKMRTLNEYMCKFVQSSNALKKVLAKEFDGNGKERLNIGEPFFNLGLEGGEKLWRMPLDGTTNRYARLLKNVANLYRTKFLRELRQAAALLRRRPMFSSGRLQADDEIVEILQGTGREPTARKWNGQGTNMEKTAEVTNRNHLRRVFISDQ